MTHRQSRYALIKYSDAEQNRRARAHLSMLETAIEERDIAIRDMWRLVGFSAVIGFFAGWLFAGGML